MRTTIHSDAMSIEFLCKLAIDFGTSSPIVTGASSQVTDPTESFRSHHRSVWHIRARAVSAAVSAGNRSTACPTERKEVRGGRGSKEKCRLCR